MTKLERMTQSQTRAFRQYHHPLATDAHFPLTPALSLREREGHLRRAETPCACSKIERWKSCTLSLRERAGVRGKEMLLRPLTGGTDERRPSSPRLFGIWR